MIVNQDDLKTLCNKWQQILNLQHWDVFVKLCRLSEFDDYDSQGEIDYTIESGKSIIKIIDSADYPQSPFMQDMEQTLVHELLHLKFSAFEPNINTLEYSFFENTINSLATTLVELSRKCAQEVI